MADVMEVPPSTSQVESNREQLAGSGGLALAPPSAAKYAITLAAVSVLQLGTELYCWRSAAFISLKQVVKSPTVAWHVDGTIEKSQDAVPASARSAVQLLPASISAALVQAARSSAVLAEGFSIRSK
jgi:hypothetical protein